MDLGMKLKRVTFEERKDDHGKDANGKEPEGKKAEWKNSEEKDFKESEGSSKSKLDDSGYTGAACDQGIARLDPSTPAPTPLQALLSTFNVASGILVLAHAITSNPFGGLDYSAYLSILSEQDAFATLIDAYRLRLEDEHAFIGYAGGLYANEDPLPRFKRFLNKAETRDGILPAWWSKEKRRAGEKQAGERGRWSNIYRAVEVSDIVEHYDWFMPMMLRMLAEKVYGRGISRRTMGLI
ncbi:MAG: hypothetical protein Q9187_001296 [Circinaria calcarea]